MERIYIALVDTPGLFASLIHRVIKRDYIHVALSLDENLDEAYSVGRRNPFIPYFPGLNVRIRRRSAGRFPRRVTASLHWNVLPGRRKT